MTGDRSTNFLELKKRINKSSKRDKLVEDVTIDIKLHRQKVNNERLTLELKKKEKAIKPTTKSITVTSSKLLGHYQCYMNGKNLIMGQPDSVRVYCLPVEITQSVQVKDSLVDDWELLVTENDSSIRALSTVVNIIDCKDLQLNLLKGYIPIKDGGNSIGSAGRMNDITGGMKWMAKNYEKVKSNDKSRLFNANFVIANGAARRVMTSQFNIYPEKVHLVVIRLKGTCFIWNIKTDENCNEFNNKRSFAGLRFEDFASRGMDGKENEPSSNEQNNYNDALKYYNVVDFNFGEHKMIVFGEVDCVIPLSSAARGCTPKADDFIELKTSLPLENWYNPAKMSYFFRHGKVASWFAQCILMGIKQVVVGIRSESDDEMTCMNTRAFTLDQLRQHSNGSWSKNRCFDALNKFLLLFKEKVTEDDSEVFYCFSMNEGVR